MHLFIQLRNALERVESKFYDYLIDVEKEFSLERIKGERCHLIDINFAVVSFDHSTTRSIFHRSMNTLTRSHYLSLSPSASSCLQVFLITLLYFILRTDPNIIQNIEHGGETLFELILFSIRICKSVDAWSGSLTFHP